ncbi:hypothetical protein LTH96_00615 [Nesterenkonia sp. LB17]|uniref:GNAT family N-acetyltransferase n=1 Tax=Nesterenkonia sp. LB17 TaxID=2901230 RepID=UPI001F4CD862|nr:hypothetical protein [Nesterenkonia sp. LB17]
MTTWQETYTDLLPAEFFTEGHSRQRREMWARILSEQRAEWSIRVAESDGEIIGFAMAGPVSLWVAKQNPRAMAFYRRNGFRCDGTEKRDPGASAITDIPMVRP